MNDRIPPAAALSGLAYVLLAVLGNSMSGGQNAPGLTSSRSDVAVWLAKQHSSLTGWVGGYLELAGLLCFIVFLAALFTALRGGVAATTLLGAGLVSAAVKLASAGVMFAVFWRAKQGFDPQLSTALIDANSAAFILTWALDALVIAGACVVTVRTRVLPRWLTVLGFVAATLSLLSVPVAAHAPPFGMLLTLVWFAAASIVLSRRGSARVGAPAPAAA